MWQICPVTVFLIFVTEKGKTNNYSGSSMSSQFSSHLSQKTKTKTVQVLSESLFLEGPVIGALNTTKNVTGVALTLSDLRRLTHNMSCFASVVRKMRRVKPTV